MHFLMERLTKLEDRVSEFARTMTACFAEYRIVLQHKAIMGKHDGKRRRDRSRRRDRDRGDKRDRSKRDKSKGRDRDKDRKERRKERKERKARGDD